MINLKLKINVMRSASSFHIDNEFNDKKKFSNKFLKSYKELKINYFYNF